jgi:integrase/recombinase XerD
MRRTDFARTLTRFLSEHLPVQRNVSTNTIKSYRDAFKQLLTFCNNELDIKPEYIDFDKINADTVKSFLLWLEQSHGVCINTRNQRLAAIHSFYRYSQTEYPEYLLECQRILSIPFKKHSTPTLKYLSKECLKILFEQPDTTTAKGRRDLTILIILYDTGARVQELINLKVSDIRLHQPSTVLLWGKGNKKRSVPIMKKTCNILQNYMEEHRLMDNGKQNHPLFYNSSHKPLTRPGISYILEKYLNKAKNTHPEISYPDSLNPHMFRHTKAMHLLDSGVNLIFIRDLLGHVSVTTTEHYARVNSETKRKALESAYIELVTQDIPNWQEDTDLLKWLNDFCR